jgi:transposase
MSDKPLFELAEEDRTDAVGQPAQAQAPRAGRRRFKSGERHQIEFCELSLDHLVPHKHPVRDVDAWVEAQDLSELHNRYQAVEGGPGRTPIDPGVLLKLWIFATLESVGSARELSELIQRDNLYKWLAGGMAICHRVLSEFRVLDGNFMERLLVAHVSDLLNAKLVTMETVAQDGMRVRANAGKSSFHRESTLEALEVQVEEQLQKLREELDHPSGGSRDSRQTARRVQAKEEQLKRIKQAQEERTKLEIQRASRSQKEPEARASTTDPEARTMKMANGGFNPAFNVQYATDVASGVILYANVINQGTDAGQIPPALTMMSRAYHKTPGKGLGDGGFATSEDIDGCHAQGTVLYAPIKELKKKLEKGLDPYAPQKGDSEAEKEWRQRMGTDEAKAIYRLRCQTAEWVNAQTRNHGFQHMPVRGLKKARCIALLHALAHNMERDVVLRSKPRKPE